MFEFLDEIDYYSIFGVMFESYEDRNHRIFRNIERIYSDPKLYESKKQGKLFELLNEIDKEYIIKNGQNLVHYFTMNPRAKTNVQTYKSNYTYYLNNLLQIGYNINKKDDFGKAPICYSDRNTIEFFLDNAKLSLRDNNNYSILYHLSKNYDLSLTKAYLKKCDKIMNHDDYDEYMADEKIHKAIQFSDISNLRLFIITHNKYINNRIKTENGEDRRTHWWIRSPVQALTQGHKSLDYGVMFTPLLLACRNGSMEMVDLLLENGAEPDPSLLVDLLIIINPPFP